MVLATEKIEKKNKLRSFVSSYILKRPTTPTTKTNPPPAQPEETSKATSTPYRRAPDPSPLMAPSNPFSAFRSKADGHNEEESLIIRFYDPEISAQDSRGRTLVDIMNWSDARLETCHDYIQIVFPLPESSGYNYGVPLIDRTVMEAFRSRPKLRSKLRMALVRQLQFYGFKVISDDEVQEIAQVKRPRKAKQELEAQAKAEVELAESTDAPLENVAESSTTSDPVLTTNDATIQTTAAPSGSIISGFNVVRGPQWVNKSRNWCVRFDHNHLRITRILRCLRILGLQEECEAFFSALQDVYDATDNKINERSMGYWRKAFSAPLYRTPDGELVNWLRTWETEEKAKAKAEKEKEKEQKAKEGSSEDAPASKKVKFDTIKHGD